MVDIKNLNKKDKVQRCCIPPTTLRLIYYSSFFIFIIAVLSILNVGITNVYAGLTITSKQEYELNLSTPFISQYPDPVAPGEIVEIRFRIENLDMNKDYRNITIRILPTYPFTLLNKKDSIKTITLVPRAISGLYAQTLKYKLIVDKDCIEGEYPIDIELSEDQKSWVKRTFYVNVRTTEVMLSIDKISLDKEIVGLDENFNVYLKIKNTGKSEVRDATLTIDVNEVEDSAVSPGVTNKFFLGDFEVNEIKELNIPMFVSPEAELKPYNVPITLKYKDSDGNEYQEEQYFVLKVNEEPKVLVLFDELELKDNTIEISFDVVNAGLGDVNYVVAKVKPVGKNAKKYQPMNKDSFYIGNIESDDYETLTVTLVKAVAAAAETTQSDKENSDNDLALSIELEFYDSYNKKHKLNFTKEIRLNMNNALNHVTRTFRFVNVVFVIIVVLLIAYIIYRSAKKRKKTKR